MADKGSKLRVAQVIAAALLAGAIVGGIAVYVSGGGMRNGTPAVDGPEIAGSTDDAAPNACTAKAERGETIAAAATGEVAAMLPAEPPQSLGTLAFNDPEGRPITIASFAGKTVLVNLWATWCAPCRVEMPALNALQAKAGSTDFEVVAVNVDTGDDTKPKQFLAETGIETLAYYRDNTLGLFNELKKRGLALGLPVTLLIDPDGCLLASMNGPAEWASADALRLVEAALAQ